MAASLVQREHHTASDVLWKVKFFIAKNNLTQNNAYIYGNNYTVTVKD